MDIFLFVFSLDTEFSNMSDIHIKFSRISWAFSVFFSKMFSFCRIQSEIDLCDCGQRRKYDSAEGRTFESKLGSQRSSVRLLVRSSHKRNTFNTDSSLKNIIKLNMRIYADHKR